MQGNDRIAYCGLYCPMCAFVVAANTGDRKHLMALPAHYETLRHKPLEECTCKGCKQDEDFCGHCKMKPCAQQKGLVSCADCDEFPCADIEAFGNDGQPHHAGALQNLWRIREVGYDSWLDEMQAMMHCASCGQRQSWYYYCPEHESAQSGK